VLHFCPHPLPLTPVSMVHDVDMHRCGMRGIAAGGLPHCMTGHCAPEALSRACTACHKHEESTTVIS
jgi:hypothetical protein